MNSETKIKQRLRNNDQTRTNRNIDRVRAHESIETDRLANSSARVLLPPQGSFSWDKGYPKNPPHPYEKLKNRKNRFRTLALQLSRIIFVGLTLIGLFNNHVWAQSTTGRKLRRMVTAVPPGATVKLNCLLPKDESVSEQ